LDVSAINLDSYWLDSYRLDSRWLNSCWVDSLPSQAQKTKPTDLGFPVVGAHPGQTLSFCRRD